MIPLLDRLSLPPTSPYQVHAALCASRLLPSPRLCAIDRSDGTSTPRSPRPRKHASTHDCRRRLAHLFHPRPRPHAQTRARRSSRCTSDRADPIPACTTFPTRTTAARTPGAALPEHTPTRLVRAHARQDAASTALAPHQAHACAPRTRALRAPRPPSSAVSSVSVLPDSRTAQPCRCPPRVLAALPQLSLRPRPMRTHRTPPSCTRLTPGCVTPPSVYEDAAPARAPSTPSGSSRPRLRGSLGPLTWHLASSLDAESRARSSAGLGAGQRLQSTLVHAPLPAALCAPRSAPGLRFVPCASPAVYRSPPCASTPATAARTPLPRPRPTPAPPPIQTRAGDIRYLRAHDQRRHSSAKVLRPQRASCIEPKPPAALRRRRPPSSAAQEPSTLRSRTQVHRRRRRRAPRVPAAVSAVSPRLRLRLRATLPRAAPFPPAAPKSLGPPFTPAQIAPAAQLIPLPPLAALHAQLTREVAPPAPASDSTRSRSRRSPLAALRAQLARSALCRWAIRPQFALPPNSSAPAVRRRRLCAQVAQRAQFAHPALYRRGIRPRIAPPAVAAPRPSACAPPFAPNSHAPPFAAAQLALSRAPRLQRASRSRRHSPPPFVLRAQVVRPVQVARPVKDARPALYPRATRPKSLRRRSSRREPDRAILAPCDRVGARARMRDLRIRPSSTQRAPPKSSGAPLPPRSGAAHPERAESRQLRVAC
ncbi:hypothetical protein B0H15DRAFT_1022535 [Mycena belliarum]|uniref:Uncharacterized protein n=1 Tax=Mycena belliarum TaxID=1033014 RepID=A0AAD6U7Y0_9AGAR|nr:hypothetical protein B0H15DRAFT_1022535 [Mycena belliae]